MDLSRAKQRLRDLPIDETHRLELDTFANLRNLDGALYYDDYVKHNRVILCLYKETICVSSITCDVTDEYIKIASKTKDGHEGKKYKPLKN